jgi:dolichol-phosphate mannosyltransferase
VQTASVATLVERTPEAPVDGFRLSLVLPAWNERDTIRQAIQEADSALSVIAAEYEILVVDDGSTDETADLVRAEAWMNPHVRLIQHPRNLGYGAALRTGFRAAALDLVAFTDADCQFDLHELEYMLPLTRRYDVTCGYRIDRQDPAHRRFISWSYNTLIGVLMASQVHDLDCALKIFHRDQLPALLPECENFFVNTEIMARARLQGLSVVEVGVHHRPRAAGQSKISLRDIPRTVTTLLPFWWSRLLFAASNTPATGAGKGFWAGLLLLILVAAAVLFPNLSYPLVEPDEGRYAEIGREMLVSGDWLVPRLNHQPYYDKPPLFHWLVAGSFHFFGMSEWSARLVPAFSAFLTVLAIYVLGRRLLGTRAAFYSGLALLLMPGFAQCGRILILDSVLSLFVAIGILTAYLAVQGDRLSRPWWIVSAIACALGVLTKGPVALVLLAPPVMFAAWLQRSGARPGFRSWLLYVGVVSVLAVPWYAALTLRDPHFAYYFLVDQHLVRFFTGEYHEQPFWFYVPVLAVGCLPWSLLLVPLTRYLLSRSPAVRWLRPQALGLFLLWAGWCVLFFSLSRGKLPPYILPATPALALVIGCYLDRVALQPAVTSALQKDHRELPRQALVVLSGTWLVVSLGAGFLNLMPVWEAFVQGCLAAGALATLLVWGRRLPPRAGWLMAGALGAVVVFVTAHSIVPTWSYRHAPLNGSERITDLLQDGRTGVVCYGGEWGSVPFYAGRDDNFFNFSDRPPQELAVFLSHYSRYLLILKHQKDVDVIRWAVPAGMELINLADAGDMRVILVQSVTRHQ